ncbi:MAG: hypothetical protein KF890_14255 [Nitrospira sp.]|nr:hypothetical protein [Nitrospira sp.]
MKVNKFCNMMVVPVNKRPMRRAWFFTSYFISDLLELPPLATHMVWRREKRTSKDTAPMIVGLVLFERTVRVNKLLRIPGIHCAGPTKSFESGFAYFSTVSSKVVSQVHVLGPVEELGLDVPSYENLYTPEQEAERDMRRLIELVDQGNSLRDVYMLEPVKALKWHSFLELMLKEKTESYFSNTPPPQQGESVWHRCYIEIRVAIVLCHKIGVFYVLMKAFFPFFSLFVYFDMMLLIIKP